MLAGLRELEYRGYDSAGIALLESSGLKAFKAVGKLDNLAGKVGGYLHAEGYPAGEMKHGPIALADAELFTIALMARTTLWDKIKSNVEELSARDSTIVAITPEDFNLADDIIRIRPHEHPMLEFFENCEKTQYQSSRYRLYVRKKS